MTELASAAPPDRIGIAQLNPSIDISGKVVEGIVTLIWPYSVSNQTISILLAEPDFRLRRQRGQVRVQFRGSSAKSVARCNVQSGDHVRLSLLGVQWERDQTASGTPGRGIEWELRFEERIVLNIQREAQDPIDLDIDHPEPSPERRIASPLLPELSSQLDLPSTPLPFSAVSLQAQAWLTPAFLKRDRLSTTSYFGSDYDPFDEDEFKDNNRRKKTKFGRTSNQWKFTEQSSSPESAGEGESSVAEQPAVHEATNGSVNDQANATEPQESKDSDNGPFDKRTEHRQASREPALDARVQVDDSSITQTTLGNHAQESSSSPRTLPQHLVTAVEDHILRIGQNRTEILEQSEPADVAADTDFPVDASVPPAVVDIHSTDQSAGHPYGNGAASSPMSGQGRASNVRNQDETRQDDRSDDIKLDEADEGAKSEDIPTNEADERASPPTTARQPPNEDIDKRQSREYRLLSLGLGDSHTSWVIRDAEPAHLDERAELPHDSRSKRSPTAEDEEAASISIEEIVGTQGLTVPTQEPTVQLIDHGVTTSDQQATVAVTSVNQTEGQPFFLLKEGRDPANSSVDDMREAENTSRAESEDIVSQSDISLPEQVVRFSAPLSEEAAILAGEGIPRETFAESESDKGGEVPTTAPGFRSEDEEEESQVSDDDVFVDEERRTNAGGARSDGEEEIIPESEEDDYISDSVPEANHYGSESETEEPEQQEATTTPHSSGVQIITIDDSDEEDIDVAQSQTDGAVMSVFPGTRRQSHPKIVMPPKQEGGSLFLTSSPPPLDTIPDSQAAIDVVEPIVDDVIPKTEEAVSDLDLHEEPQAYADQANANARFLAASVSSEIPFENHIDPRLKNKVLTPNDTQPREELSQASDVSLQSLYETHDLPTPQFTQNRSSDILLPASLRPSSPSARSSSPPAPEIQSSPPIQNGEALDFVDQLSRLKDKTHTPLRSSPRSRRVSNIPPSVSPWFAPRRSSEVVPDSRSQSEVASEEDDVISSGEEAEVEIDKNEEIPSSALQIPNETITSKPTFHRIHTASPAPAPSPPTGLRTSHGYYAPLYTLPSHFNATTSILSIVLASTPIARANSGPRDFYTTIFLTDPSSLEDTTSSRNSFATKSPAFTIARLFRPSRPSLPQYPSKGDILLLRSCTVTSYARSTSLLSTNSSAWALFSYNHKHDNPSITGPPVEFGAEERGYVRGLWEWWEQLSVGAKEEVEKEVDERLKKLEEKEERERAKGRRLKGMGLRLAPGTVVGRKAHELRDGKEWSDDKPRTPRTPRRGRVVRHELRDGKEWVDEESSKANKARLPSATEDILQQYLAHAQSRTSSISSISSSSSHEDIFSLWQTDPPSHTHSVTEGIEPDVKPRQYVRKRPPRCLVKFKPGIWRPEIIGPGLSRQQSPGGTSIEDGQMMEGVGECLRDRAFERKEKAKVMAEDKRLRDKVAGKMRRRRRKRTERRMREKREEFRLPVAEWEVVKNLCELEDEDLEGDNDDDEGEGGMGLWLKIALRRSQNQKQISPERSEVGDSKDSSEDVETSTKVSISLLGPILTEQTPILKTAGTQSYRRMRRLYVDGTGGTTDSPALLETTSRLRLFKSLGERPEPAD
ncbi:MAG: hypothetical protein Q9166_004502 [cf. Caloplaca sp. 2 TL-2023]